MSKIRHVEVHQVAYQAKDFGNDGNPVFKPGSSIDLTSFVIVIMTDEGVRGEYAAVWAGDKMTLAQTLNFAPRLVGRDPHRREELALEFIQKHRKQDKMGYGPIDICLWDLAGKEFGTPIYRMLGGYRTELPAYASTLFGDRNGGLSSPDDYADYAEYCLGLGYVGFKVHTWTTCKVREECRNLRTIAARVGGKMAIMLDCSSQLRTFAQAIEVGRVCDEIGAMWYEDPFLPSSESRVAHRKLRQLIKTPLLITEHVRGLQAKADFVIADATDFLRADPEYDVGITGVMKTAHLAEALGIDVELHGCGPAHRHCIAAIPNTNFYELILAHPKVGNHLVQPVYAEGYRDEIDAISPNGTFSVPEGPGLGVTYDWDWINAHRIALHVFAE
ncbi:enolase C-terminal domain-like protein [Shumkonia mesophila]|uniref:enolase C-terminal domain-like protein n=1 Tax=Shumkonia mesophila TaxID=2838854 RepID=UPI0029342C96|nr:enolase C-terminal domain-like protein [Shumkonia mesophila]